MDVFIFMLGAIAGIALVLIILIFMRHAAEQARADLRRETARIQNERDAAYESAYGKAYNKGYDRAIKDYKRRVNRTAAEQFAETFENRRAKFQVREAQ